jgi:hypothetical protein
MGKLGCICGHTIADQTDNILYKGYILPDSQLDNVSVSLTDSIDSLLDSIKSNKRLEWIKKNFHVPSYPTDLKDSSMIHDLLSRKLVSNTQDIFECENCGRIAIQVGQTNQFKFFSPDTDDTKGILRGEK